MTEQEILGYISKIINNEQMSVSAAEAKLLVACQEWVQERLDGEEKQQGT